MDASRPADLEEELARARREIAELEADRRASAGVDPLTGLLDLRQFCLQLDVELGRSRRCNGTLSVALLDLDRFGAINDLHGREVGDEVLRAVGATLSEYLRAYDIAARACDDEFAVMLPDTDFAGALQCMERILLELSLTATGPLAGLSVSVGVASTTEPREGTAPTTAVGLLGAAARALDRSRAGGGGRVGGPSLASGA